MLILDPSNSIEVALVMIEAFHGLQLGRLKVSDFREIFLLYQHLEVLIDLIQGFPSFVKLRFQVE
jgi:hypothetical protein